MTDLARQHPKTEKLSRSQLERDLLTALAAGPDQLSQQIQTTLILSQLTPEPELRPRTAPFKQRMQPPEARLVALTNMAESLNETQIAALYEAIKKNPFPEIGILSQIKLALFLPPQYFQPIIRAAWETIDHLESAELQAQIFFELVPLLTLAQDEPAASPILLEIVALAQAIGQKEARIRSLVALVPYLPHTMRVRVLHRVIDEIDKLSNDSQRATALCTLAEYLTAEIETRALRSAESLQVPGERARAMTALARHLPMSTQLCQNALNAIGTISEEEERAEALINFAAQLDTISKSNDFPQLLEQALAIATSVRRRTMRARVLVALAPHLTADLQGEALSAVHSLSNERERAALLAQLAPNLPSALLMTSLVVAHGMQSQEARVHALSTLARAVPGNARDQTILDALNAAANLPHQYERVNALMALLDILPPQEKEQTYTTILNTAQLIENESARARTLSMLSATLPTRLLDQALENTRQLENPDHRFSALASLAQVLPAAARTELSQELLASIKALPFEYKRARALADSVPLLSADSQSEALHIAQEIVDPVDRVTALTALLPMLSGEKRREVIVLCWHLVRKIENGYDAASALSNLAPLLPPTAAKDLARSAGMIIGSIMDEYDQASAITILAPLIAVQIDGTVSGPLPDKYTALERGILMSLEITDFASRSRLLTQGVELWTDIHETDQSYRLWQNVIQRLSSMPLADTILIFSTLTPVIRQLTNQKGVKQLAQLLNQLPKVAKSDQ